MLKKKKKRLTVKVRYCLKVVGALVYIWKCNNFPKLNCEGSYQDRCSSADVSKTWLGTGAKKKVFCLLLSVLWLRFVEGC